MIFKKIEPLSENEKTNTETALKMFKFRALLKSTMDPVYRGGSTVTATSMEELFLSRKLEWGGHFTTTQEAISTIKILEFLLFSYFCFRVTDTDKSKNILISILEQKDRIDQLIKEEYICFDNGGYPSVYFLYEMMSLRRLISHWTKNPSCEFLQGKLCEAFNAASDLSKHFESNEHTKFQSLLSDAVKLIEDKSAILDIEKAVTDLEVALFQAALETPMEFPDTTFPFIRIRHSDVKLPSGICNLHPKKVNQEILLAPRTESSSDDTCVDEIKESIVTKDISTCNNTLVGQKRLRSSDDDIPRLLNTATLKENISRSPSAISPAPRPTVTKPSPWWDLEWGPGNGITSSSKKEDEAAGETPNKNNNNNNINLNNNNNNNAPKNTLTKPKVHIHQYPCRSQYHAKFSLPEKHASESCFYCSTCHCIEFIFNGCVRDCTWKHFPTPKKISLALHKNFPELYIIAMDRYRILKDPAGPRSLTPLDIDNFISNKRDQ